MKQQHPKAYQQNCPKIFNKAFSKTLTDLINLSFITAIFPSVFKSAQVLLTFKKGNNRDNNYRPISLISNVMKILEKLMYERLSFFHIKITVSVTKRSWCMLFTLTYFFLQIHSSLLQENKVAVIAVSSVNKNTDHCPMIYVTR